MPIQPYPLWDMNYIVFLQAYLSSWSLFFQLVSIVISPPLLFIVGGILYLFNKEKGKIALTFLILALFFSLSLKDIIHHPRPFWTSPYIIGFIHPRDYGMPSGHALFSVFTLVVALLYKKKWGIALSIFTIIITCLSRMVLGAHFTLQIVTGLCIGFLLAFFSFYIYKVKVLSSLPLKKKVFLLLTTATIVFLAFLFLYLYRGMYFSPLDEWSIAVSKYTPKPIHDAHYLTSLLSFVFCVSSLLAILIEREWVDFQKISFSVKPILLGSLIVCLYISLILILLFLIITLFGTTLALLESTFLLPWIFFFQLPLESSYIGLVRSRKIPSSRLVKWTFAYYIKKIGKKSL